ncbi:PREDICTED: uncharacterized protein LOC105983885 [Dipodomys ordii]|uniref:Uncharacterized protein LOC105983885 n=1 Tax=Dipodomys ordii TaxID=10020 RepID=A0A1S3EZN6_DIPOR|nr:PREDICTED: uncharacterized protein LOC105983885 [Dipodomys ordii]
MFCIHSFSFMESAVLLVMSFDRFVAICHPLRYSVIITVQRVMRTSLCVILRGPVILIPIVVLLKAFPYCRRLILSHSFCHHQEVIHLACVDTTFNNLYGLSLVVFTVMLDLVLIALSYGFILHTVAGLASQEEQRRAFQTCTSHLCAVLVFFMPMMGLSLVHRFGKHAPPAVHILLANIYLFVPPMLNPIIYSIKTKEICRALIKLLGLKKKLIPSPGVESFKSGVYTPNILGSTLPRSKCAHSKDPSVHTPQIPVCTLPYASVHTLNIPVSTLPKSPIPHSPDVNPSVHTPQIPVYTIPLFQFPHSIDPSVHTLSSPCPPTPDPSVHSSTSQSPSIHTLRIPVFTLPCSKCPHSQIPVYTLLCSQCAHSPDPIDHSPKIPSTEPIVHTSHIPVCTLTYPSLHTPKIPVSTLLDPRVHTLQIVKTAKTTVSKLPTSQYPDSIESTVHTVQIRSQHSQIPVCTHPSVSNPRFH